LTPPALRRTASSGGPLVPAVRDALRPALGPWLALHLLVLTALALAALSTRGHLPTAGVAPGAIGWWGWDAAWYRAIGEDGYVRSGQQDVRFFPLLPLAGRAVAALLPGIGVGAGVAMVASVAALAYLVLVARLGQDLLGSVRDGRRTAWIAAMAPGAAALALPYTEALAGALAVGFFLALRRDRALVVAATGIASGLTRPTGLLLAVPAALWLVCERRQLRAAVLGLLAPPAGAALYLLWSWTSTRDLTAPYRLQADAGLRGGLLVNPVPVLLHDPGYGGIPVPATFVLFAVAGLLLALALRTLPLPYTAWSAASVVLAVSSAQAHSVPRYLAALFPLLVVAVARTPDGRWWRVQLFVLAALSGVLTTAWFAVGVVP